MKAKNIFTKGFLLASVFALSGCSSFLDEKIGLASLLKNIMLRLKDMSLLLMEPIPH